MCPVALGLLSCLAREVRASSGQETVPRPFCGQIMGFIPEQMRAKRKICAAQEVPPPTAVENLLKYWLNARSLSSFLTPEAWGCGQFENSPGKRSGGV